MKCVYIIILLILLSTTAFAYTEIEYSLDNATWQNAGFTNENQIVFEELGNGIDAGTTYYFRIRHTYNTTNSSWVYIDTRTKEGGLNQMELSIVFILITFILISGGLTLFFFTQKHDLVYAFFMLTLIFSTVTGFIGYRIALADGVSYASTILKMTYGFGLITVVMLFYILIILTRKVLDRKNTDPYKQGYNDSFD